MSCGNGTLPRSRTCENEITNEVLGNALCGTEAANEVVECNTEPCPGNIVLLIAIPKYFSCSGVCSILFW